MKFKRIRNVDEPDPHDGRCKLWVRPCELTKDDEKKVYRISYKCGCGRPFTRIVFAPYAEDVRNILNIPVICGLWADNTTETMPV